MPPALPENQRFSYTFDLDPSLVGPQNPHTSILTVVAIGSFLYWDKSKSVPMGWHLADGTSGTVDCRQYTLSHPGSPTLVMIEKMQ